MKTVSKQDYFRILNFHWPISSGSTNLSPALRGEGGGGGDFFFEAALAGGGGE